MKRFTSLLMTAVLLTTMLSVFAVPAFAAASTSGSCGDNLKWSINSDYTVLTITGSGDMKDYGYYSDYVPWWDYRNSVTTINFPTSITHISDYAFCYFSKIEDVWIPSDNVTLGYESFYGCGNLKHVAIGTADGTTSDTIEIGPESFEQCGELTAVYCSRGLKKVKYDGFEQCYKLYLFYYDGLEQDYKEYVTIDMGSDDGNRYLKNVESIYYRDEIWDTSKWYYNDKECWHGLREKWIFGYAPYDLVKADVTPLPAYENDGTKCWQVLPDGTKIHEQTINWEYNDTGYFATLPNGQKLSGTFEWQSDGYKHWHTLPNGEKPHIAAHTRKNGICTVCGNLGTTSLAYIDKDGKFAVSSNPVLITADTRTLSGGDYAVFGKVTIPDGIRLEVSSNSSIILMDDCELDCTGGIHVQPGKTLTIYSESLNEKTMGSLIATASKELAAGIGTNADENGANIIICGGKITSKGNKEAAGIGSAIRAAGITGAITVNIYNGIVKGIGGENAAGIGSGQHDKNFIINIYNGNVEGIGGENAAGIGNSMSCNNTMINIYNGRVKGIGGECGAGIGSGWASECKVNVYNGIVEAQGGDSGSGIGAGKEGKAAVYISKTANVTARGGKWASDISVQQYKPVGSTLSGGNWWIIIAVAVLALGGVAALFIVKKKKKPALADGEETDEE